ncbi:MAG TPA: OmpA family protein [Hyphomicrobiaceae bacterium]|nr:OmpA family protein [Hyphomicrobiaceae bacterium]
MAPSTLRQPGSATIDRRDAGGPREMRPIAPDGDRKRWRSERRQEESRGGFANIDALKSSRKERRLDGGATIFEEPDSRRIIRSGDRSYIMRDETSRLRRFGKVTDTQRRPGGGNITTIISPDGARIITETSPDGRLIRRYRRTRDGRDVILIDNRRTWRKWGAIGAGAVLATGLILALDPPHYRGPRDRYIVEYDHASYDDIYGALMAPPIDDIGPRYTLDQVLFNYNLRERMRRIDLDSINFDTGSWDIDDRQFDKLETLARAIDRILERNPDEVFLIEGHTDAVGDAVANRSLSDRRAEEVANILTEEFRVPPENLVIQGYGEEFLKVPTEGPSRANRRVTVRRITPLLDRRNVSYRDQR